MVFAGVLLFLTACILSVLGTFLARRYAQRLGLMDDPGHRKVHTVATPRNGGIGIFWGFALPLVAAIVAIMVVPNGADFVGIAGYQVPQEVMKHLPGMR